MKKFQHKNGVIYEAKDAPKSGSCEGCVFYKDGKTLKDCVNKVSIHLCASLIYDRVLVEIIDQESDLK